VLIDVVAMGEEWKKFKDKIIHLQSDLSPFQVDFLDRDSFKRFCDNLRSEVGSCREIYITGYFSETIRETLQEIAKVQSNLVRLICPEFPIKSQRDRRNLGALKKLAVAGAEIKFNNRLHARFLVANNPAIGGLLVIGSFDFNTECIGRDRYDAGIKTRHPDLIKSAMNLFEQIWNEPESITLEDFVKKGKS
jgi:hypothetical protein